MKLFNFFRNSQNEKQQMKDGLELHETALIENIAKKFEAGGWNAIKGLYSENYEVVGLKKVYVLSDFGLYDIRFVMKGHLDKPLKFAHHDPIRAIH